jgi:replicative DNA helicase
MASSTTHSKLRITEAADQFASEPLYVDDRGGLTMLDIRGRARLAVRRWGVKAIFVDYLQLVSHVGAQSRENEVGFVSRGFKAMSMELAFRSSPPRKSIARAKTAATTARKCPTSASPAASSKTPT